MDADEVRRVLAERLAAREQDYKDLPPLKLRVHELAPERTRRVRISHALMVDYSRELSLRPLALEQVTAEFLARYLDLYKAGLDEADAQEPQDGPTATVGEGSWDAFFCALAVRAVCFSDAGEAVGHLRDLLEVVDGIPSVQKPLSASSDEFWELLEGLCLALQLERAQTLVDQCTDAHPFFATLSQLLGSFPGNMVGEGAAFGASTAGEAPPRSEFWAWRRSVLSAAAVAQGLPLPWGPALSRVLAILSGRNDHTQHWLRAAIAQFAYLDPDASQWPTYIEGPEAQQVLAGNAPDWEVAIARAMDGRVQSALFSVQALDSSCAAILSEFLYRANKLRTPFASTPSVREYLGLCHALECLESTELKALGLDVLVNMGTPYALSLLASALPQLGLEARDTRAHALELCAKFGFADAAAALHNKIGEYELHRNVLQALSHFYLASNLAGMVDAVWAVFERMLVTGEPVRLPRAPPATLEPTVAECVAPLAVLSGIIQEEPGSEEALRELLRKLPPKYTPLLIAYASSMARHDATVAALMRALADWTPTPEGLELLRKARSAPWAEGIDDAYDEQEILTMLHRKLAEILFV